MKKAMKVILKNDKMRKFVCLLACGWGILGLSSCQDTQLAEQLDGTWHTSFTQKDEDGIPYTEDEDVKFIYMKANGKDGGKFQLPYQPVPVPLRRQLRRHHRDGYHEQRAR